MQIGVVGQGNQEGASDFTVTQFIVLQGGWGRPADRQTWDGSGL